MLNKKFFLTGACVYLAYFTYGIMAIVISQNSAQFMTQWNTDLAGIMKAIAWTGLAKFLSVWICGEISDKIGRRKMLLIGAVSYVVFFGGLMMSTSLAMGCFFAFFGGAATSFFDGGSYPALQESFPKAPGSALVLVKGFISFSGMFYPLLVGMLNQTAAWSLVLWLPMILSVGVLVLALISPFSYDEEMKSRKTTSAGVSSNPTSSDKADAAARAKFVSSPKFQIEGIGCMIYGGISMMTFYLIQQCITIYGKDVIGMGEMASRALMTYYTLGSLVAVLLSSVIMARGVRTMTVLLTYTFGSVVSLALMCFIRTPMVTIITSFAIGFFAAGGVMQAGIALMGEFFPGKKGRNLGIYYTCMGLASYLGPYISSKFLAASVKGLERGSEGYLAAEAIGKINIMYFDLVVAIVGFALMVVLSVRHKVVFGKSVFSLKKAGE